MNSEDINSDMKPENINLNPTIDSYQEEIPEKLENSSKSDQEYSLGWNKYSEITNGRFAMLGFLAIIIIEIISNNSFLHWAGIIN